MKLDVVIELLTLSSKNENCTEIDGGIQKLWWFKITAKIVRNVRATRILKRVEGERTFFFMHPRDFNFVLWYSEWNELSSGVKCIHRKVAGQVQLSLFEELQNSEFNLVFQHRPRL